MMELLELYFAYENVKQTSDEISDFKNSKQEIQEENNLTKFVFFPWLSPIIVISILGIGTGCFGYYIALEKLLNDDVAYAFPTSISDVEAHVIPNSQVRIYRFNKNINYCVGEWNPNTKKASCILLPEGTVINAEIQAKPYQNWLKIRSYCYDGENRCVSVPRGNGYIPTEFVACNVANLCKLHTDKIYKAKTRQDISFLYKTAQTINEEQDLPIIGIGW